MRLQDLRNTRSFVTSSILSPKDQWFDTIIESNPAVNKTTFYLHLSDKVRPTGQVLLGQENGSRIC
jgi:hypothetical protein